MIERRLRWAGIPIAIGLFIQLVTFFSNHATAFLVFAIIGTPLVIAGTVLFLFSLVSRPGE